MGRGGSTQNLFSKQEELCRDPSRKISAPQVLSLANRVDAWASQTHTNKQEKSGWKEGGGGGEWGDVTSSPGNSRKAVWMSEGPRLHTTPPLSF